ncbi:hypothetical protein ABPG74_019324 [Tetrahymena malaccensis]
MIIKSTTTLSFYIFFLLLKLYVKALDTYLEGCSSQSNIVNDKNQKQCTQCYEGYQLNTKENLCVYTKCNTNQYYDKNLQSSTYSDFNSCTAICSPPNWKSRITSQFDRQSIISFYPITKIISMQNKYLLIYNMLSESIAFQIFYDQIRSTFSLSTNYFTIIISAQQIILIDQFLFVQTQSAIFAYEISVSQDSKNLILQNQFLFQFQIQQSSNYFNIFSITKLRNYVVTLDSSIQLINLNNNNNQIQKIQIGFMDNQTIIKAQIFYISDTNQTQYLIISTINQLIFYDIQANTSDLIIPSGPQIKDFEICNIYEKVNQLLILYESLDLQVFQFDKNLQKFIQNSQKTKLNYYPKNIYRIKYQNTSSSSKEYIDEIIYTNPDSIQIIKKGSLQQQQKGMIQIQTIIQFNSSFPTPTPNVFSTAPFFSSYRTLDLFYYPQITILLNNFNEINFYDCSDGINCKFKKQFFFEQVEQITKFYNNKVIVFSYQALRIFDIYTQSKLLEFQSTFLQYATNYDKLIVVAMECLRVYSSDLSVLYENCKSDFQNLTSFYTINLNNDLRFLLTYNINNQLNLTVYQIDLTNQSIQKLGALYNSNCNSFKIIKKFASLQDELTNNFFIEQIVIVDTFNNLKIYDLNLQLIYQVNQLQIQYVYFINRVANDDKTYILVGSYEFLVINVQNSNQNLVKLDFYIQNENQIYQIEQKINGQNKFYFIKLFSLNKIYEFYVDMQRNLTNTTLVDYVKVVSKYPFLKKNIRRSINITINYFAGDSSGQLLTSLSPQSRYTQLIQTGKYFVTKIIQIQQLGIILNIPLSKDLTYFDMFTNKEVLLPQTKGSMNTLIKQNTAILFWQKNFNNNELYDSMRLVDLTQKNAVLSFKNSLMLSGVIYSEDENLIYAYGERILILNLQLQLVYTIQDEKNKQAFFDQCENSQDYLICLKQNQRNAGGNEFEILIFHKILKYSQQIYLGLMYTSISMVVDIQYQNIFILQAKFQIYSFQGYLKQTLEKQIDSCLIQPSMMICESQKKLLLIDRLSLVLTELGVPEDDSTSLKYIFIDFLNYLLFQTSSSPYKISVIEVSSKKIINTFSSKPQQNQNVDITDFQFDYSSSSCLICMDRLGNFYLFSLDRNYPFQNNIIINEFNDSKIKLTRFYYNNITNDIYTYWNTLFQFDISILGQPYESQLNHPYNLFTKVFINSQQTDYLIFNKYNNTIFRYTRNYLKFEIDISGSKIVDIQYNQIFDVLVVGLEDSILLYEQYQFSKDNNLLPNIYKIDNIQFQQFITDSIIITFDQLILHLNLLTGEIINRIQFNSAQLITSFILNKNQDILLVGFNDKQVLLYSISDKKQFLFGSSVRDSINTSITIIQFIESQQLAYAVSNRAIAVFFVDKFELFLIQGTDITLVSQQIYSYPRILDYHFDSLSNSVKIIGMHKNGIFENNYNLDNFSQNTITECTLLISNSQIAQIKQNLDSVYPKQIQSQSINGVFLTNQLNYQTYVYLQVTSNDLQKTIEYISQFQNRQFVVSSYSIENRAVPLSNDTFSSLSLPVFQLANFNLDFQGNLNLNININQNENTQEIVFQNISISFQCLGTNQIIFQDIQDVIFQNIYISYLDLKGCTEDQIQANSLFLFYNISQIYIYNLEIFSNNFKQISDVPLFQFDSVKSILISRLNVVQNTNLNSLMTFLNVYNVTLLNLTIQNNNNNNNTNNNQIGQAQQNYGMFSLYKCQIINLINSSLQMNNQSHLFYTQNSYTDENQTTALEKDVLNFQNVRIDKNQYTAILAITIIICYYIKIISQNNPFVSFSIQKCEIASYTLIILKIFLLVIQLQNPQAQRLIEISQILIDYFFFFCFLLIVVGITLSSSKSKLIVFIKKQLLKVISQKSLDKFVNFKHVSFKAYMKWILVYKKLRKRQQYLKKVKNQQTYESTKNEQILQNVKKEQVLLNTKDKQIVQSKLTSLSNTQNHQKCIDIGSSEQFI